MRSRTGAQAPEGADIAEATRLWIYRTMVEIRLKHANDPFLHSIVQEQPFDALWQPVVRITTPQMSVPASD